MQIISRKEAKQSGARFYFTGKPCIKEHVTQRRTASGKCVECEKSESTDRAKSYYQRNKEKVKAKVKEYREKNLEKVTAQKKQYYEDNKEKILASQEEYRKQNKERISDANKRRYYSMTPEQRIVERERVRIAARKRYWKDPERFRAEAREHQRNNPEIHAKRLSEWKENNQDKVKQYRQRPEVKAKARFFINRRRAIKKQAIPKWANLEAIEIIYETCPKGWHVDHIVPLVSRIVCGLHCEANLRHLPAKENMSKNNHHWPDMP